MKHKLFAIVALSTLAAPAALLFAQYGPPGGPYQPQSVSALVNRVHVDLDHGYNVWHLRGGDRDRLTHAERQLRDFSRDWNRGKFDKGDLDQSIASIQHILDNNHLTGPERDALSSDVDNLRQMREAYDRHEIGYR